MGLNLIVLVKQVPDTQNVTGEAMKEDGTVNRAVLPAILIRTIFTPWKQLLKSRMPIRGQL